jgi:mRNA interferase YafQ
MLTIIWEAQFKKDFNLATKRKKKLEKLENIISALQDQKLLPPKNRNHKLKGNYINCWECHIEPDWLDIQDNK